MLLIITMSLSFKSLICFMLLVTHHSSQSIPSSTHDNDIHKLKLLQKKNIKKASNRAAYLVTHKDAAMRYVQDKEFKKNGVRPEKRDFKFDDDNLGGPMQRLVAKYFQNKWGKVTIETTNMDWLVGKVNEARHQFVLRKRQLSLNPTDKEALIYANETAFSILQNFQNQIIEHHKQTMGTLVAKLQKGRSVNTYSDGVRVEKRTSNVWDSLDSWDDEDFILDDNMTDSQRKKAINPLDKRALLESNSKNEALWGILFSFFMIPFMVAGFSLGFGAIIASFAWLFLFLAPVTHKILFDKWF